jgi:hypothetical protein
VRAAAATVGKLVGRPWRGSPAIRELEFYSGMGMGMQGSWELKRLRAAPAWLVAASLFAYAYYVPVHSACHRSWLRVYG